MANNRLYLVCKRCEGDRFAFAKYFPSSGYYTNRTDNKSLNDWLDKHLHEAADYLFSMQYEVPED